MIGNLRECRPRSKLSFESKILARLNNVFEDKDEVGKTKYDVKGVEGCFDIVNEVKRLSRKFEVVIAMFGAKTANRSVWSKGRVGGDGGS